MEHDHLWKDTSISVYDRRVSLQYYQLGRINDCTRGGSENILRLGIERCTCLWANKMCFSIPPTVYFIDPIQSVNLMLTHTWERRDRQHGEDQSLPEMGYSQFSTPFQEVVIELTQWNNAHCRNVIAEKALPKIPCISGSTDWIKHWGPKTTDIANQQLSTSWEPQSLLSQLILRRGAWNNFCW